MEISTHGEVFIKMADPEGERAAAKQRTRQTSFGLFFSLSNADSQDVRADKRHVLLDLKRNLLIWKI